MRIFLQNRFFIWVAKALLLACCSMFLISCASVDKYSFEKIGNPNHQIQLGNFDDIKKTYEEASGERNRNSALWDNQLGSIYLAQGDYEKALDAFLRAHYLMNDIPAFKELERKAVALTGSEDKKAYKGDPYEKAMNSLYVGLLLYDKGDLGNAMAAFKNGILADSDSEEETYKSDIAILYLLASRVAKKIGNESLSNDYSNAVKELVANPNYSLLGFSEALMQKMLDLNNNVLLVIEFGEGPTKYRMGRYGEMAAVNGNWDEVQGWRIKIDGESRDEDQVYSNTDVFFQASTRGGRAMDGILKGKAQFKTDSANTAVTMIDISSQFANQANQARAANPYVDTTGYALASGICAIFAGCSAIASSATNPKADIRCWTLLPEHVIIFPLFFSIGKHSIDIEFLNGRNSINRSNYKFDVDIQNNKDSVIFKRILRYQVTTEQIAQSKESAGLSEKVFKMLIDRGKDFDAVERLLGTPLEKRRDLSGKEIWIFSSDKPGISNCVYFKNGIVSELVSQSSDSIED